MSKDLLFFGPHTLLTLDLTNFLSRSGYSLLPSSTLIDKLHLFIGWHNPIAVIIDLSIFKSLSIDQISSKISSWQFLKTNFILLNTLYNPELLTRSFSNINCMEMPIAYNDLLIKLQQFEIPTLSSCLL